MAEEGKWSGRGFHGVMGAQHSVTTHRRSRSLVHFQQQPNLAFNRPRSQSTRLGEGWGACRQRVASTLLDTTPRAVGLCGRGLCSCVCVAGFVGLGHMKWLNGSVGPEVPGTGTLLQLDDRPTQTLWGIPALPSSLGTPLSCSEGGQ